ncbi:hypothetical protein BDZ91DRAFT_724853 [Kalaharituber pfeilii]|nr:hypothetical protein BDZ91DRAFT_724853 [Kalaharituber pfeilii]
MPHFKSRLSNFSSRLKKSSQRHQSCNCTCNEVEKVTTVEHSISSPYFIDRPEPAPYPHSHCSSTSVAMNEVKKHRFSGETVRPTAKDYKAHIKDALKQQKAQQPPKDRSKRSSAGPTFREIGMGRHSNMWLFNVKSWKQFLHIKGDASEKKEQSHD